MQQAPVRWIGGSAMGKRVLFGGLCVVLVAAILVLIVLANDLLLSACMTAAPTTEGVDYWRQHFWIGLWRIVGAIVVLGLSLWGLWSLRK